MRQIWYFLRSVSVHFGLPSNLTLFGWQICHPFAAVMWLTCRQRWRPAAPPRWRTSRWRRKTETYRWAGGGASRAQRCWTDAGARPRTASRDPAQPASVRRVCLTVYHTLTGTVIQFILIKWQVQQGLFYLLSIFSGYKLLQNQNGYLNYANSRRWTNIFFNVHLWNMVIIDINGWTKNQRELN